MLELWQCRDWTNHNSLIRIVTNEITSFCIRFRVQFRINLHEWVFQTAEIARAASASAISSFCRHLWSITEEKHGAELEVYWLNSIILTRSTHTQSQMSPNALRYGRIGPRPCESVGHERICIFHRCGEEGGVKSSGKGSKTLNFAGTDWINE